MRQTKKAAIKIYYSPLAPFIYEKDEALYGIDYDILMERAKAAGADHPVLHTRLAKKGEKLKTLDGAEREPAHRPSLPGRFEFPGFGRQGRERDHFPQRTARREGRVPAHVHDAGAVRRGAPETDSDGVEVMGCA